MPVEHLFKKGVIYMWIVNSFFREAVDLIKQWGYEHADTKCWFKTKCIEGEHYLDDKIGKFNNHPFELCLVGTKGNVNYFEKPMRYCCQSAAIVEPREKKASQKPEKLYRQIEQHWDAPVKIELYARSPQCH